MQLDWCRAASLTTEKKLRIEFQNGRAVTGQASLNENGIIKVGGPEQLTAYKLQVAPFRFLPEPKAPIGFLDEWHGNMALGYMVARGNTDLNTLSIIIEPKRRTRKDRYSSRLQTLSSEQNGRTTSNLYRGNLRYDRFLSPRTFFFGGDAERDRQQLLTLRSREGGGFGIDQLRNNSNRLSILAGATFLQEKFAGSPRHLGAEVLFGFEIETNRFKPIVLTSKGQFRPILSEDRYLAEWKANIRLPLFGGFNLGMQFFDDYHSRAEKKTKKNDFGILSTFGWTF